MTLFTCSNLKPGGIGPDSPKRLLRTPGFVGLDSMTEHALNVQPANPRISAIDALEAITKLQEALTKKAQKLETDLKKIDRLIVGMTAHSFVIRIDDYHYCRRHRPLKKSGMSPSPK